MTWLLTIALALGAFALGAFALGVARGLWTTLAAALSLGLAGYALQASPGLAGAPAAGGRGGAAVDGFAYVEARQEMVALGDRSSNSKVLISDGFARRGQYANAASLLRGAVADNPRDAEAWLALGNALVEHAGGALTEPALYAYRRAAELQPQAAGPGYFLGMALIRQGNLLEARGLWQSTLEAATSDAAGRAALAERLGRLDALLIQAGALPRSAPADGP